MSPENNLIVRAAVLARQNHESWNRFVEAMAAFSAEQIQNCIKSDLSVLPVTQGRAQLAAHLHGLLANCMAESDKIESKRK